jgi:hypothetical protein
LYDKNYLILDGRLRSAYYFDIVDPDYNCTGIFEDPDPQRAYYNVIGTYNPYLGGEAGCYSLSRPNVPSAVTGIPTTSRLLILQTRRWILNPDLTLRIRISYRKPYLGEDAGCHSLGRPTVPSAVVPAAGLSR